MKKLVAITGALALLGCAAYAQAAMEYSLGVKGGVNFSDISDEGGGDVGRRTGIRGGAFLSMKQNERFGWRIEALYVQKGEKGEVELSSVGLVEAEYKTAYIEFPLLAVAHFPADEQFTASLFAGPTLGVNVTESIEAMGTSVDPQLAETFEFGLDFGGGGEIVLSSASIVFDLRYSLGLSDVIQDIPGKNRGIGFMVGVAFPLGGSRAPKVKSCKVSPVELEELREDISVTQKDLKTAQDRQQALAADLAAKQAALETKRSTPDELRRKLEATKKGAGRTEKAKTDTKAGTPKKEPS